MTTEERARRPGRHHFRPPDPSDLVDHPAPVQGVAPASGDDWEYPRPPRPWYRQLAAQWPLFVTLLVVAVGVGVAGAGFWRRGSTITGAGVLLAAVLRLVLPERAAGLLCCRSRTLDVLLTVVLGVGILVVAWVVPPARP